MFGVIAITVASSRAAQGSSLLLFANALADLDLPGRPPARPRATSHD